MKMKCYLMSLAVTVAAGGSTTAFAQWGTANSPSAAQASALCTAFPAISTTTTAGAGVTNGQFGAPAVGEIYTLNVTGPGTGAFRLVGDPGGTVTYAGPANVPASISYTVVSATPPAGAAGMGFYFDSGSGTVTITATCAVAPPASIPASNAFGKLLLGMLLALGGGLWIATVRSRSS
jgi:hypothetical protein